MTSTLRSFPTRRSSDLDLHVDAATLTTHHQYEGKDYMVWHYTPPGGASAQQFLVDSTGTPQFLVDPGINGTHKFQANGDRKSTRLNSSHRCISYAVFCL